MPDWRSLLNSIKEKVKKPFQKGKPKKGEITKDSSKDDIKKVGPGKKEADFGSLKEDDIQDNIRKARRKGFLGSLKRSAREDSEEESKEKKEPPGQTQRDKKAREPRAKKKRIRRFFYRGAIFIFLFFHVIIGAVYIALSPSFVEKQIIENFNKMSYGTITLKVKKISPLTGFLIEDIEIRNGPEFDRSVFFKLKRLKISYSLPTFLALNINIPEIGIYSPHLWLKQKNGIWNFAKLMKPGTQKPPEPKKKEPPKKEEPAKSMDKIELPIALKFLFNFILDDLRAYVDAEGTKPDRKDKFNAGLEGFGFKVAIDIPPTKVIPLVPPTEIISIFKKIKIRMNKNKPLNVWYRAKDIDTKPGLYLHFLTYLNKDKQAFNSRLKVGIVKTRVRIKRKILAPLDFLVEHDLQYEPKQDKLTLNYFRVVFKKRHWLNLKGTIEKVQTGPKLDIKMARSNIVLNDLYPYFRKLTGNRRIKFGGRISLKPLVIKGKQDDLKVDGALNLYRIRAKVPGLKTLRISRFHLDYHTHLAGNPPAPTYFRINNLYGYLNGARLRGRVGVNLRKNIPHGPMKVAISLLNLRPERFVNAGAYGPVNFRLRVNSTSGLRDIMTRVRLDLKDFIYTLNGSRSRPLNLNVGVDIFTAITNKMKNIDVDLKSISVVLKNRKQNEALRLGIDGKIALRQKKKGPEIKGVINLTELFFHQKNLYDTMPDALRGGATRDEQPLKHPVTMDGAIKFSLAAPIIKSSGAFDIKAPTFDVNDLKIAYKVKLDQEAGATIIESASVASQAKHFKVGVRGKLAPKKVYDSQKRKYVKKVIPDIYASVAINSPVDKSGKKELFTVYKTPDGGVINIGGDILIKAHIRDQDLDGAIVIKKFFFNDGKMTSVEELNMNFPFELKLDYQKKVSKLEITQADVLKNFNFTEKPNFTIKTIKAKHPARNKPYSYLKDFEALMFVRDNTFELKKLRATILDGQLIGKDTLFYLGNLKPEQMEYRVKINVVNIDMAALDQTVVKKQEEGGLLSAYINLAGKNPAAVDPRGYIVVNKIGPDIANKLMKALNEKEGESKLGIAQYVVDYAAPTPDWFEFRIGDGNIYSKVGLRRAAASLIGDLHPETLRYDRISIQEFLAGLK